MKRTSEAALLALILAAPAMAEPVAVTVTAAVESEPTSGDADDPAIWINPADPAQSLILGTDKTAGLYVYALDGTVRQFLPDGELNNVDIRPFTLNGEQVWLAGATRRNDGEAVVLYVLRADGTVEHATPFAHPGVPEDLAAAVDDIYGFALGQDAGGTYVFVNYKSGDVIQWRVTETAPGTIGLEFARHLKVATQPEGMVSDDHAGHLYVGEEDVGIWRFPLDPAAEPVATAIDMIPSACLPRDDVEGLAIHDGADRYLVASAQGVNRAVIYRLDGDAVPECVGMVEVGTGTLDAVSETDGLDVTALPVGPDYPAGLLVMMDDQNAGFTTNFKLIDWAPIAAALAHE